MRNWIRHVDERIGNLIIFNWKHGLAKTAQQWSDEELAERLKLFLPPNIAQLPSAVTSTFIPGATRERLLSAT